MIIEKTKMFIENGIEKVRIHVTNTCTHRKTREAASYALKLLFISFYSVYRAFFVLVR